MPRQRTLDITATRNGARADVRVIGEISEWSTASAREFERQVQDLVDAGVRDAHVFIDSGGGNVVEANRIVNTIRRFTGRVTGEGGALVASAATFIALHLEDFAMPANGMWMIHKPSAVVQGDEDELEASLEGLRKITGSYKKAYAKKTGKSEDEVEKLWAKGDRWFTAQEAVAEGFIARVIDQEELDEEAVGRIAACGCPADKLPKAVAKPTSTNQEQMDIKAMRATLGMPETATEAEVMARVNELKLANERHVKAADDLRKTEVKALIDKAVTDRRITEAHRASYEAKFAAAFDATKAELEGLCPAPSMADVTDQGKGAVAKGREAWTYEQWADKDLKGLQAMMKTDPDKFSTLYEARYGKKPTLPKA